MKPPMPQGTDSERTKPHRRVEKCLEDMNLSYMSEHSFPPYRVDIYLPEWHLAIEVDGPYHSKKHDEVRDRWMLEWHGVRTLRIDATIWKGANKLKLLILKFIEDQCGEVDERKELYRSHA